MIPPPQALHCYENFSIVEPNSPHSVFYNLISLLLLIFNKVPVIKQITKPLNMPNPLSKRGGSSSVSPIFSKKHEVVLFSSTAIALYGYDQGMIQCSPIISSLLLHLVQE